MDRRWEAGEGTEGPATLKVIFRKLPGGHSSDKGLASWSIGWVSVHPRPGPVSAAASAVRTDRACAAQASLWSSGTW